MAQSADIVAQRPARVEHVGHRRPEVGGGAAGPEHGQSGLGGVPDGLVGPTGGVVGMAVNLAVFLIVSKATGTTAEEKARVDAMFEVGKRPTRTAPVDLSFEDQIEELATNPAPEKI